MIGVQVERLQSDTDDVLSQSLRLGRTQDTQRIERLYFLGLDRSVQTVDATQQGRPAPSARSTTASGATRTA